MAKRYPPSKMRYEKKFKILSTRVRREEYDKFLEGCKKLGFTTSMALRKLVAQVLNFDVEIEKQKAAITKALVGKYGVTYRCVVCRKPIMIESEKAKAAAASYMTEHGWGHSGCHERNRI